MPGRRNRQHRSDAPAACDLVDGAAADAHTRLLRDAGVFPGYAICCTNVTPSTAEYRRPMTSIWWWLLLWTFVCGLAVLLSVAGAAAAVKARTRKVRVRDGVAVNVGGSVAAKIASRATAAAGWWFLIVGGVTGLAGLASATTSHHRDSTYRDIAVSVARDADLAPDAVIALATSNSQQVRAVVAAPV